MAGSVGVTADSATERIMVVLESIAAGTDGTNLSELSRQTGVNRVTAGRIIADLRASRVLDPSPGALRPGPRLLRLAAHVLANDEITSASQRLLGELSEQLGLSSYLVVRDGPQAVYVNRAVPTRPLVSNITLGSRVDAHLTTAGRVLLAGLTRSELKDTMGPGPLQVVNPKGPKTIDELVELLAKETAAGVAWSHSGLEPGIDSCAAAVVAPDGSLTAAISVAGRAEDISSTSVRVRQVESDVTATARAFSGVLLAQGRSTFG